MAVSISCKILDRTEQRGKHKDSNIRLFLMKAPIVVQENHTTSSKVIGMLLFSTKKI